jgi:hypothetical protein
MKSNKIRLTENDIKHIVTESVKRILKENEFGEEYLTNDSDDYDGYKWSVFLGKKLIKTSDKIFNDIDEAADDCDIFLKEFNWKEKAEKWNAYHDMYWKADDYHRKALNPIYEEEVAAIVHDSYDTYLQNLGWGWMD